MKALFRSLQVGTLAAVIPATVGFFFWELAQANNAAYGHFLGALFGAPVVCVALLGVAVWAGDRA